MFFFCIKAIIAGDNSTREVIILGNGVKPVIDKKHLKQLFFNSTDFLIIDVEWPTGKGILCYYSSLAEGTEVNKQINIIRQRASEKMSNWGKLRLRM